MFFSGTRDSVCSSAGSWVNESVSNCLTAFLILVFSAVYTRVFITQWDHPKYVELACRMESTFVISGSYRLRTMNGKYRTPYVTKMAVTLKIRWRSLFFFSGKEAEAGRSCLLLTALEIVEMTVCDAFVARATSMRFLFDKTLWRILP